MPKPSKETPPLEAIDGFSAKWDQAGKLIVLITYKGVVIVSPDEVRRLYRWVEGNELD